MRRLLALAAFLAAPLSAAPTIAGEITGAFDEKPGVPLPAVEVVALRSSDSTLVAHTSTGEDGAFRLERLAAGRYRLRATLLGHLPWTRDGVVLTDAAPSLDLGRIVLAVSPIAVPGVATETERATAIVQADRSVYLTRDLPAAPSGTATDVLRAIPELDVDIDGHVSLRGSSSVTIQFDGRRSPVTGDALATYLKQFPAGRIERVEVIPNPSAKYDPEGTGGIVNLVLQGKADLGLSGSLFLGSGSRNDNSGARVAWQRGPVTLFAGVSGYWSHNHSSFDESRLNLLAQPPTSYRTSSRNDYPSGFGMSDLSVDWMLSKRSTLYGTLNGWVSQFRFDGTTGYALLDASLDPLLRYDRAGSGGNDGRNGSGTLGFRRVVNPSRNEWTVEYKQSGNDNDRVSNALQTVYVPADSAGVATRQDATSGYAERALEADLTLPLGAKGRLEAGYNGSDRRNTATSDLRYFDHAGVPVAFPPTDSSDYVHREIFHAGYLTLGSTVGRASLQLGARAEGAHTTFDLRDEGRRFRRDYRSLFPSANAAWDFGSGRTLRLSYSKRIERPSAYYLNPHLPTADTLSRYAGNPDLGPKYTHSWSLDASWAGSRGLLRLSPYYRRTVDNWDRFTSVDSTGAAVTTWLNASAISYFGVSLTGSLRQTGRLGGTVSLGLFRERHDASNLSGALRSETTNWSASGNLTFKAASRLDLQGSANYQPARTLAQGRIEANVYSYVGVRWKITEQGSMSVWASDPFNVWRYRYATRDATYVQESSSRYSLRSITASLRWSWGKPPEQKPRRQGNDAQPQQPGMTPP